MNWWKGKLKPDDIYQKRMEEELAKIRGLIGSIPKDKTKEVIDDIEKKSKFAESLIKHYLDLSKVLDQRRGDYYKAALQLAAIGLTGFGLLIKLITFNPLSTVSLLSISVCLGLVVIVITAFEVIHCFYWQTKSERYHFLNIDITEVPELGNSWAWFYHGVQGVSKIPFTAKTKNAVDKLNKDKLGVEGYISGASYYFDKFINATPQDFYAQNLKHAYLLLIHNAYKNKFERQLTDILSKGTNIVSWVVGVALSISMLTIFLPGVSFNSNSKSADGLVLQDTLNVHLTNPEIVPQPLPVKRNISIVTPADISNKTKLGTIEADTSVKDKAKKKIQTPAPKTQDKNANVSKTH